MSKGAKIFLVVLAVLIIAGIIIYAVKKKKKASTGAGSAGAPETASARDTAAAASQAVSFPSSPTCTSGDLKAGDSGPKVEELNAVLQGLLISKFPQYENQLRYGQALPKGSSTPAANTCMLLGQQIVGGNANVFTSTTQAAVGLIWPGKTKICYDTVKMYSQA